MPNALDLSPHPPAYLAGSDYTYGVHLDHRTTTPTMKMYGKHRFPGKLFIVEGIDGSGKSTQIALLQKWLESEGYVTFFSEWNSSPLVREVTRRGKPASPAQGRTVHHRRHGFLERVDRFEELHEVAGVLKIFGLSQLRRPSKILEVHACTKRKPFARQDDDPYLMIAIGGAERIGEFADHHIVERIPAVGPIQRDGCNAAPRREEDRRVIHRAQSKKLPPQSQVGGGPKLSSAAAQTS